MSDIEAKIRAKARELWLAEGQPEGKADQHWLEAEAIILGEAKPKADRKPRAATKQPTEAKAAPAKKPAAKKETAKKETVKKPSLKVVSG